jgi:hypothetical protein
MHACMHPAPGHPVPSENVHFHSSGQGMHAHHGDNPRLRVTILRNPSLADGATYSDIFSHSEAVPLRQTPALDQYSQAGTAKHICRTIA